MIKKDDNAWKDRVRAEAEEKSKADDAIKEQHELELDMEYLRTIRKRSGARAEWLMLVAKAMAGSIATLAIGGIGYLVTKLFAFSGK